MQVKSFIKSVWYLGILIYSVSAFAQNKGKNPSEGQIESGEVDIVRERKITLSVQSRNFEKIPASQAARLERQPFKYQFTDQKLLVAPPDFNPVVSVLPKGQNEGALYNSEAKIGVGNYGRFLLEGNLNSRNDLPYGVSVKLKHNSTATGPVDGKNSGTSQQLIQVGGRYLTNNVKLTGDIGYDRNQFYFYGYRTTPDVPTRTTIKQVLNQFNVGIGLENAQKDAKVDYSIATKLQTLSTFTEAKEYDWGTNLKATFPITSTFLTHLAADAYVTQRTDSLTNNRNLFRIKPTFQYRTDRFSVLAGINVVHETDNLNNLTKPTHGYPVIQLDYTLLDGIHVFAGYEGDVQRNTLRTLTNENQFLAPNVKLLNTEKVREFYIGSKGGIGEGFTYEAKVSFGGYRNFYVFNNAAKDTSRFDVLYDTPVDNGLTNVIAVSGQLNYQHQDWWRSYLKFDVYGYDLQTLDQAWHRPTFTTTWSNSLTFQQKLILSTDFYFIGGLQGRNPVSAKVQKLPTIVDLNLRTNYLLTDQFSVFVGINNIIGKNYQRYQYYRQQGINFLAGVSYQF
ncbi:MAG: TonB-dependent receptor [Siphonobacter sp.]